MTWISQSALVSPCGAPPAAPPAECRPAAPTGLHDVDIAASHAVADVHQRLAVRRVVQRAAAQPHVEPLGDLRRQIRVRVAREDHDVVLRLGHLPVAQVRSATPVRSAAHPLRLSSAASGAVRKRPLHARARRTPAGRSREHQDPLQQLVDRLTQLSIRASSLGLQAKFELVQGNRWNRRMAEGAS